MKFSIALVFALSFCSVSAFASASAFAVETETKKSNSNRRSNARPNALDKKGKAGKSSKKVPAPSIRIGQDFDDALKVMSKLGPGKTPDFNKKDAAKKLEFKRWEIGDGLLFAVYSAKEKKITGLFYSVPAGDSKEKKKRYRYRVKSYSPKTGEMKLVVPNKLSDKEPDEKQPPNFF